MRTRSIVFSIASLSLIASCDHRVFDDLEDQVWVRTDTEPSSSPSAGFGIGLVNAGGSELQYVIASESPPALFLVKVDANGSRSAIVTSEVQDALAAADRFPTPAVMASDAAGFGGDEPNVAVATINSGSPALYMLKGETGEASVIQLAGSEAPSGIAFGDSDASAGVDLFAVSGQELNLVANYQAGGVAADCNLGGSTGDILIADVDAPAGGEVLISVGGEILVTTGTTLATAALATTACFAVTAASATITAPNGEASFGTLLRQGDFDGNGVADLVVGAPAQNAVYVFLNWTVAAPSTGTLISAPSETVNFGSAIAIGDFGGDGRDDLVISDPAVDVGANPSAGSVYIYAGEAAGTFAQPIVLHDATPQDNQVFGQSLTVAEAFGGPRLVVGAKNEVFTYFQTPVPGDSDFRN
tara:strand:- start:7915 stop:9159 length:1245 start_codon:yes stop_codon:yes gene_type:complete